MTYKDIKERTKAQNEQAKNRSEKCTIFSMIFENRWNIERRDLENIAQEMSAILNDIIDGNIRPRDAENAFIENMKEYHED